MGPVDGDIPETQSLRFKNVDSLYRGAEIQFRTAEVNIKVRDAVGFYGLAGRILADGPMRVAFIVLVGVAVTGRRSKIRAQLRTFKGIHTFGDDEVMSSGVYGLLDHCREIHIGRFSWPYRPRIGAGAHRSLDQDFDLLAVRSFEAFSYVRHRIIGKPRGGRDDFGIDGRIGVLAIRMRSKAHKRQRHPIWGNSLHGFP